MVSIFKSFSILCTHSGMIAPHKEVTPLADSLSSCQDFGSALRTWRRQYISPWALESWNGGVRRRGMETVSLLSFLLFEILGNWDQRVEVTLLRWLSKSEADPGPGLRSPSSWARVLLHLQFPCLVEGQNTYLTSGKKPKSYYVTVFWKFYRLLT